MSFAPLRVGGSWRDPFEGWRFRHALALIGLVLLFTCRAQGQTAVPAESARAMPAVINVGLPAPASVPLVAAAGAGYGWMDTTDSVEGGHRMRASIAAAYAPFPAFSVGLDMRGHWDRYSDDTVGERSKLYGEPRLTARFAGEAARGFLLGAEADARFVGADAPSIEIAATSPSLRGLAGLQLSPGTWLGAQLGVHIDRSSEAIPEPDVLTSADKRTLGASASNAIQWGVGVSHQLASKTELLGEVAGEVLIGAARPSVSRSPYRISAGARHPLSRAFSVMGVFDVALSKRPRSLLGDELVPVEPRVGVGFALLWHFDSSPPEAPPPKAEPEPEPEPKPILAEEGLPPPVPVSSVKGTVVDEGGRPLADAEVTLTREGEEPRVTRTAAGGEFEFAGVPDAGAVKMEVTTPGFEAATLTIVAGELREREIMLRPAVPAGQVRGKVLDLQGKPIQASVTITPGDHAVAVQPDGSFDLELAPGTYTVKFQHEDFSTQWRKIRVHDRGVVILNIALTK